MCADNSNYTKNNQDIHGKPVEKKKKTFKKKQNKFNTLKNTPYHLAQKVFCDIIVCTLFRNRGLFGWPGRLIGGLGEGGGLICVEWGSQVTTFIQTRCNRGCSMSTFVINEVSESVNQSAFSFKSSEHHESQTVKARELKFWTHVHSPQQMSHVACHMSHVTWWN